MGNCAPSRHAGESWADDGEWEEASSTSEDGDHHHHHASEVTIRTDKRQLHELMERKTPGGRGSSTRQLLADIMDSGEI
uniref:Uncharacterized protein n=1 Tax=Aegilops tauschii TaxID=37682 RepID=R7WDK6_AEGTA